MKFSRATCEVLYAGQGHPKRQHGLTESSPEEKHSRVLVDEKLIMTQQLTVPPQETSRILGGVKRSVTNR